VKKIATWGTDSLMNLVVSAYGRQDELEADRLGIKYMDLAGFKPQGMIDTLEVLAKEEKGGGAPLLLRTHPYLKDRIAAVKAEITRLPAN
jgi:beta-barrel assembly-enhancing protease